MACTPFSFRRQPNGDRSAVIFSSWDCSRFSSPQSAVRTVTWWPRRARPSESARTFTGGPPNSRKGAYVPVTFRIRIVRAGFFSVIWQKLRNGIRIPRAAVLALPSPCQARDRRGEFRWTWPTEPHRHAAPDNRSLHPESLQEPRLGRLQ